VDQRNDTSGGIGKREQQHNGFREVSGKGTPRSLAIADALHRMLPYVDGSHHLDEILYRAALSRKAIRTALADYDGFLVSFIQ
jgi:hypothetical protein